MPKTVLVLLLCLSISGPLTDLTIHTRTLVPNACAASPTTRQIPRIVVPHDVKTIWKSVDISVLDQKLSAETVYTVDIGETYHIPGSVLSLTVNAFLPAFIMNGSQMTSLSNEPQNPAVYVVIEESGETVFTGWLFSLYPDACAIKNPRYGFNLTGYHRNP